MTFSISDSLRPAVRRFAAGAAVPLGIVVAFSAITHYQVTGELPDLRDGLGVILMFAGLIGGYVATLRIMAPRLRDDADFHGRRGTVAGIAAGALFITLAPFISVGPLVNAIGGVDWSTLRILFIVAPLPFAVLAGAVAAAALFFPWLRSDSEQREHRALAVPAPAAALAFPLPIASTTSRAVDRTTDSLAR